MADQKSGNGPAARSGRVWGWLALLVVAAAFAVPFALDWSLGWGVVERAREAPGTFRNDDALLIEAGIVALLVFIAAERGRLAALIGSRQGLVWLGSVLV